MCPEFTHGSTSRLNINNGVHCIQVSDAFGASVGIVEATNGGVLYVATSFAGSRRRQLAPSGGLGISWGDALSGLSELSAKRSARDMNVLLSSMALELGSEKRREIVSYGQAQNITSTLLSEARAALSYVARTEENVCESLGVLRTVTALGAEILGPGSAAYAAGAVLYAVSDRSNASVA